MPRTPALILGGIAYTKSAATAHFGSMLRRYELGDIVNDADRQLLVELLARHPRAPEKIGPSVAGFRVARDDGYRSNRRFEIVRTDGATASFSYLLCILPPADPHLKDLLWALRCEVLDQTRTFFDNAFRNGAKPVCPISNAPLTRKSAHVDHAPPHTFRVLAHEWITLRNVEPATVVLTKTDSISALFLADRTLAADWHVYHAAHATLRLTTKSAAPIWIASSCDSASPNFLLSSWSVRSGSHNSGRRMSP